MIILDTNVVSALMRSHTETGVRDWLDRQPSPSVWTTSVTVMEVRFGLAIMTLGRSRARLQRDFEHMLRQDLEDRIVPFDTAAAEQTAALMARRQQSGRTAELRDTMIAGIAIARHATVATRNIRHFDDLPVAVVDPWTA
jgi:predicted nucleic acid-binding protein